jgi:hypothetical protein
MGVHVAIYGVVLRFFDWSSEVLLEIQIGPHSDALQSRIIDRAWKSVAFDVIDLVVGNHVM